MLNNIISIGLCALLGLSKVGSIALGFRENINEIFKISKESSAENKGLNIDSNSSIKILDENKEIDIENKNKTVLKDDFLKKSNCKKIKTFFDFSSDILLLSTLSFFTLRLFNHNFCESEFVNECYNGSNLDIFIDFLINEFTIFNHYHVVVERRFNIRNKNKDHFNIYNLVKSCTSEQFISLDENDKSNRIIFIINEENSDFSYKVFNVLRDFIVSVMTIILNSDRKLNECFYLKTKKIIYDKCKKSFREILLIYKNYLKKFNIYGENNKKFIEFLKFIQINFYNFKGELCGTNDLHNENNAITIFFICLINIYCDTKFKKIRDLKCVDEEDFFIGESLNLKEYEITLNKWYNDKTKKISFGSE